MRAFIFPGGDFQVTGDSSVPLPDGATEIPFPADLAGLPASERVWNGKALVPKSSIGQWWLDPQSGDVRAFQAGAAWVAISDPLAVVRDASGFRAVTSVEQLTAYASAVRYAKETGGIALNGAAVRTDRDSQAMLTGAVSFVQQNPTAVIQWKSPAGFVALGAAQIVAIASAVGAHVQACFAAEAKAVAGILASPPTITSRDQVDAIFATVA